MMRDVVIKVEVKNIEEALNLIEKFNNAMMNSTLPSSSKLEITIKHQTE